MRICRSNTLCDCNNWVLTNKLAFLSYYVINSLLPNDAIWRNDLCELSISLREFIWGFNTRCYTLVQGFCFFWWFLMGCKELKLVLRYTVLLSCAVAQNSLATDLKRRQSSV